MRSKVPEGRSGLTSEASVPRSSPRPASRMERIWAMMRWAARRKEEMVARWEAMVLGCGWEDVVPMMSSWTRE